MRIALLALVTAALACGGGVAPPARDATVVSLGNVQAPPGGGGSAAIVAPAVTESDAAVPIEDDDAVWGSRLAPVTIVEFSDFQCPYCGRAEKTLESLKAEYGKDKLRVVFKHEPLPFHPNARPAAEAAAAVRGLGGDDAFWRFHALAFANQTTLSPMAYEGWARQAGVNVQAFREALTSQRFAAIVERDHKTAAAIGVNGTPAFYINGVLIGGAQPIDRFEAVIGDQLKLAQAALEKGVVQREALYKVATGANYKPPSAHPDDDDAEVPDTSVWRVPVAGSPTLGPATALVTVVEFSDFQCPFCSRVEPTLVQLRAQYGDKVRFVWKNEPLSFHPHAVPAAMLALEARAEKGDVGFWAAHDKLFAQQDKLEDADLNALGVTLGLDARKVAAAISAKKYQGALDTDTDLADDVQASGTPHFFINGHRLVGAQPLEKFQQVIDAELKSAQALVAAGTAPGAVYDQIMKTAKGPTPPTKLAITPMAGAPVRGDASATITVVEYSDFECPFCSRVEPTIADVLKNYGKQVRLEWHDMPLSMHPHAHLAAEAARAVLKLKGKDAFWKYHDALFALQKAGPMERAGIEAEAQKLGVDMIKLKAALDAHTYAADVDADAKTGTDAGLSGTPAFVINGYLVNGAQPYAKFRRTIDLAASELKAPAGKKP